MEIKMLRSVTVVLIIAVVFSVCAAQAPQELSQPTYSKIIDSRVLGVLDVTGGQFGNWEFGNKGYNTNAGNQESNPNPGGQGSNPNASDQGSYGSNAHKEPKPPTYGTSIKSDVIGASDITDGTFGNWRFGNEEYNPNAGNQGSNHNAGNRPSNTDVSNKGSYGSDANKGPKQPTHGTSITSDVIGATGISGGKFGDWDFGNKGYNPNGNQGSNRNAGNPHSNPNVSNKGSYGSVAHKEPKQPTYGTSIKSDVIGATGISGGEFGNWKFGNKGYNPNTGNQGSNRNAGNPHSNPNPGDQGSNPNAGNQGSYGSNAPQRPKQETHLNTITGGVVGAADVQGGTFGNWLFGNQGYNPNAGYQEPNPNAGNQGSNPNASGQGSYGSVAPQKSREVSHSTKISGGYVGAEDIARGLFGTGSFGIEFDGGNQAYYPNNNNQRTYRSEIP